MPIALILKSIPGLLKTYWKPLAVVAILCSAFFTGWKVNGWRLETHYEAERNERARIVQKATQEALDNLRADYEKQLLEANGLATSLSAEIAAIRQTNEALSAEIDSSTTLVKSSDITCTDNETGLVQNETQNPFSDDFVRLWNDAGRVRDD